MMAVYEQEGPVPKNDIEDGGTAIVTSRSSGRQYQIKRDGNVYYCDCPAWKFQKGVTTDKRTCKHIKEFRGAEAEAWRVSHAQAPRKAIIKKDEGKVTLKDDENPLDNLKKVENVLKIKDIKVEKDEEEFDLTEKLDGTRMVLKAEDIIPEETKVEMPSVLLANKWDETMDPKGMLMSEKLDGVRAYWHAESRTFFTRQGNEIFAPEWFKELFPPFDLDGELFSKRGEFQKTVSIVRRQNADDEWKDILYYSFDVPGSDKKFIIRHGVLIKWVATFKPPYMRVVKQERCEGREHLKEKLDEIVDAGGEGIMLRDPESKYVNGRSSTLLKVKKKYDAEGKIIGYTDGTGKHAGRVGALKMVMPNGKEFKIGTGMSDDVRDNPPKVGAIVTYTYQELTKGGIPRFASFLRVREDVTWDDVIKADAEKEKKLETEFKEFAKIAKKTIEIIEQSDPIHKPIVTQKTTIRPKLIVKGNFPKLTTEPRPARKALGINMMIDDVIDGKCYRLERDYEPTNEHKYYEVIVRGDTVTTRYGRKEGYGRAKSCREEEHDLASHIAAKIFAIDKIKKKSKEYKPTW